jgi:nuclear pore complex protein Nup98-Nup96
MPAPRRIQKVVAPAPDDEVAEGGYYTIPPIQTAANTASLANFVVARKGFGTISYSAPVDLTGIPSLSILREVVEIERGRVTVYPDATKAAPVGTGLNVPAEVSLENVRPAHDIDVEEFTKQLKEKSNTAFVSYSVDTGLYVFIVENFSRQGAGEDSRAS